MKHILQKLPYAFDALEPYIDAKTMEIHYAKHHQAYVDKLNAALESAELEGKSAEELLKNLDKIPEKFRTAIRNHGGGHWNHSFFWPLLKKNVPAQGAAVDAIIKKWGSLDNFKKEFSNAAALHFGSGWAWLVLNHNEFEIISTQNQDSPISQGRTPLLTLDVWEHAYYLKYQNKRAEYIEAFFKIINWSKVNENFKG